MLANLLILQIIIPLCGSLICFSLNKRMAWLFANIIMIVSFAISLMLFKASLGADIITYNLGGWNAQIGIEYRLDRLNSFFILLVSFIAMLNLFGMRGLAEFEITLDKTNIFFGLYLIAIVGLFGILISNDIFNIYVLLEVNAIASYALVASGQNKISKKAAFEYLIFGTIGSTLILFGIGFIY
ncbi:MAG: proton-conducting transporter membrane subunit, partial [Pseudomonadota bacterium]